MTPNRLGLLALTLCLGISGCTSVVNASREAPIEDDRGTRTFGSKIDDSLIDTKVGVNIAKADPALDNDSHIVVTSFNGVVLLAGQTPRADLKAKAEQAAAAVQRVKTVHNELQVLPPSGFLARQNDTWLTSKIKTQMLTDAEHPWLAHQGCHRKRHRLPAGPADQTGSRPGDQPGAGRFRGAEDREAV